MVLTTQAIFSLVESHWFLWRSIHRFAFFRKVCWCPSSTELEILIYGMNKTYFPFRRKGDTLLDSHKMNIA